MLLLVTILLVLIAAITLLIGIFSDNLALIFVSIGASALAAIVLGVLSQVSKRKDKGPAVATGPEPLPAREPVTTGASSRQAEQAAASIAQVGEPVGAPADAPTSTMPAVGSDRGLPIADYDSLRVNEILPALDDLDLDQLEEIAQHEETNKNRTTILNRIDDLMDELEAEEASGGVTDVAAAAVESIEEIGEPVVATAAATSSVAADGFPIPDYDDLDEDELIPLLDELDADQLEAVADREEAGQNRDAVLDAIDDRLDILEGIVPAPAPAAAVAAAPKKAASKVAATAKKAPSKAPAKKAAAKKAVTPPTATRKAATAAPAKKAATKKATSAPAKKAASAPARKSAAAPAKKSTSAPAKKAATKATAAKAPAKKAATATKKAATTAKKSAPVKKAGAAKKSSKR